MATADGFRLDVRGDDGQLVRFESLGKVASHSIVQTSVFDESDNLIAVEITLTARIEADGDSTTLARHYVVEDES